jgi:hypothetical protein
MHNISHPQWSAAELEATPTFDVFIAYDDDDASECAKKTYDVLVRNLGSECRFGNHMWRFDVLGDSNSRDAVAADAAQADIFVVALGAASTLPSSLKALVERCASGKTNAIALVALFAVSGARNEAAQATRDYLADVARHGGLEFFAQTFIEPNSESSAEAAGFRRHARADLDASADLVLRGEQDFSYPRWGINE